MRFGIVLLSGLLFAAPISAQGIAYYVPDNDATTGTCNVIPFGNTASSASWVNQRYQSVATAADLGGAPGFVTGLGFAPCGTGTHSSQMIRVTMAHVPPGFALAGNTNFDNNLNVLGTNATVVLDQLDYSWEKTLDAWSSLGLDETFAYDGVSDLLVDILVMGNDASNGSSSMHRATRPRLYATSWTGSPPATGTVSNSSAKMQIQLQCADATTYGPSCGGLALSFGGSSALGATLIIDAAGGGAGLPIALNIGTYRGVPFPVDLGVFGFPGCYLLSSTDASIVGSTDNVGGISNSITVPGDPNLMGARLFYQYVHINPAAPNNIAVSNGGRTVLGPVCR